jgi:hypothetical protein
MTVYFQGAEVEDFITAGTVFNLTTAGHFTTANARCAMGMTMGSAEDTHYLQAVMSATATSAWFHMKIRWDALPALASSKHAFKLYSGSTLLLTVQFGGTQCRMNKYTGSFTVLLTSAASSLAEDTLYTMDIQVVMGNPGTFRLYLNGTVILADTTLDLTWGGVTSFDRIRLQSAYTTEGGSWRNSFGEVFIADFNTINSRLVTIVPNGAGTYSAWTGAYTAVDDITASLDYMSSGTVDQRASFGFSDASALAAGERIECVKATALAQRDAAGPQKLNIFSTISSTDYDTTDQTLTVAPVAVYKMWDNSPATSTYWTLSELNDAEFGFRSRT